MIQSGTYRLGDLHKIDLISAASAVIQIITDDVVVFNETLYADSDGVIRMNSLSELLRPFCTSEGETTFALRINDTTIDLTVTWNLLTNGSSAVSPDPVKDGSEAHEGVSPVRTFKYVNADGVQVSVPIYGIEIEHPEIDAEHAIIKDYEKLTDSRYTVKHEIATARLSGREIQVLTGLLTSETVFLSDDNDDDNQVIIDVNADLVRWLNNPTEDRTANFTWRYADYNKAHTEYDGVPASVSFDRGGEFGPPMRIFSYKDKSGLTRGFLVWGVECQKREYNTVNVMLSGKEGDVDKHYRIAHEVRTDRLTRNELRALVLLATSPSVICGGEEVVIKDLEVEISSDPQSGRTAGFTWRYADTRRRVDE